MATPKPAAMWPLTVTAGVDDALHVMVGVTAYAATVAAGTYYSPSSLAAAVQAALTAAVANAWAVSVSSAGRITVAGTSAFLVSQSSGTNLAPWSQQFDHAGWDQLAATVTPNATAAPDGTVTADKLCDDATAATQHRLRWIPSPSLVANATYCFSVYAKAAERTALELALGSGYARFDLSGGTVLSTAGGAQASIVALGAGWYRCAGVFIALGADQPNIKLLLAGNPNYDGVAGQGLYLWQGQCEPAAAPGTIALTTTTALAPAADALPSVLGFTENSAQGVATTAPTQHQNAWYSDDPVLDDTGELPGYERAQGVALAGTVKSLSFATRYQRNVRLGFMEAWKVWKVSEGSGHINEALQRLFDDGWARFRWFPDQTDLATGTDYALALDTAKALARERLAPGMPLYSLALKFLKYV